MSARAEIRGDEIRQLKRELARVTEERDPPTEGGRVLRQGCKVRYALVAKHRQQFSGAHHVPVLSIRPSGFYAWLKSPLSKRTQEAHSSAPTHRGSWKQKTARSLAIASRMTICRARARPVAPTVLRACQGRPESRPRSTIGGDLVPMAANHRSWSTHTGPAVRRP